MVLSESDSVFYIDFAFCEEKNHRQLKNILIYKDKHFVMTKKSNKSLHILEDGASGVQVGDIEQLIV